MLALRKSWLIATGFLGLFVCGTFSVSGAERASSPSPASEPRFQAGDTLIVAGPKARLMQGDRVVTAVPQGQRIVVVEVRDGWVGTHVTVNGQTKAGWLAMADFLPAVALAGEPKPADVAVTVHVCESWPAQAQETEAFLIGKYLRHETDPNIHVWEPWRQ